MGISSFLKSISEFTDPLSWARDQLKTAKNDLLAVIIFGIIITIVVSAICFGIMCLRFLVFGG